MKSAAKFLSRYWVALPIVAILIGWGIDRFSLLNSMSEQHVVIDATEERIDNVRRILLSRLQETNAVGKSIETYPEIKAIAEQTILEDSDEWRWYVEPGLSEPSQSRVAYSFPFKNFRTSELEPLEFFVIAKDDVIVEIKVLTPTY